MLPVGAPRSLTELTVFRPDCAGFARVAVTDGKTAVDLEPNDAGRPQRIALPSLVSGRIDLPGDEDLYEFDVPENQTLAVRVESASLGFPLDAALRLTDADDTECAAADDTEDRRDPELIYSVALAGKYRLAVRDLFGHGGPRYVYRLRVGFAEPDFSLAAGSTNVHLPAGGKTELTIAVARVNGCDEPIRVEVQGLPASIHCPAVESRVDDGTGNSVTLSLTAGKQPFSGPIRIVGTGSKQVPHAAEATVPETSTKTSDLWLTVGAP
jgi:hypothetical protein